MRTRCWLVGVLTFLAAPVAVLAGRISDFTVDRMGNSLLLLQIAADVQSGSWLSRKNMSNKNRSKSVGPSLARMNTSVKRNASATENLRAVEALSVRQERRLLSSVRFFAADITKWDAMIDMENGLIIFIAVIMACLIYEYMSNNDEVDDDIPLKYAFNPKDAQRSSATTTGLGLAKNKQKSQQRQQLLGSGANKGKEATPVVRQMPSLTTVPSYPNTPGASADEIRYDAESSGLIQPPRGPDVRVEETSRVPKPICSELVLSVKSRFKLSFSALESDKGRVPILADSVNLENKELLHARIKREKKGGGTVWLSLTDGDESSIGMLNSNGAGSMTIWAKHGELYGYLQNTAKRDEKFSYVLTCGQDEVATLRYKREGSAPGQVFLLSKVDESQLANAFKFNAIDETTGREGTFLGLRVEDGMDPVLVILCLIGSMVLG